MIDNQMKPLNHIAYALGCLLMPVALASCSVIDEDLSGCDQPGPTPPQPEDPEAQVTYDLQLVTNMTLELQTELPDESDKELAEAIREYLKKRLYTAGVSKIEIERASEKIRVTLYTAKPGIVIGKGGQEIEKVKNDLSKYIAL